MGNEQSAPLGRRSQNKLSKPKTNASTSNLLNLALNSKSSNPTTRQNSASDVSLSTNTRFNFTPIEGFAGEAGDKWKDDQPSHRKRMSLFRSKSSQDKPKLRLNTGPDPDSPDPSPLSPLDQPLPRWSRGRSLSERSSPVLAKVGGEEPYSQSPIDM